MTAPFTVQGISAALVASRIRATVMEAAPDRWTDAMTRARMAERAARQERERAAQALHSQVMKGAVDPKERDRAKLLGRLAEIQKEIETELAAAVFEPVVLRAADVPAADVSASA